MTLLKQLVIVIVTLFVLLFAGTFTINVNNTRDYLNNQLRTISQDTANSLGLSISPHILNRDMITVESMVNAVFDSGYYRQVVVRDLAGKPLIERVATVNIEGVPGWFVRLFPLDTPTGEALVMAGWSQAGTVSVSGNAGYAYATLWGSSMQAFWWFLGSSLAVFGLAMVALHYVLRPLRDVEAQAKAICDREFPVQTRVPWTIELRSVVQAMNRMTSKVKEMFEEQAKAMERMRAENFQDATTGLPNRRYFDMQLKHLVGSDEHFDSGVLYIVELHDFKAYNERYGYAAADGLLRRLGECLVKAAGEVSGSERFVARMTGASFAVVVADVDAAEAHRLGEALVRGMRALQADAAEGVITHAGGALYRHQDLGALLGEADLALRTAQADGANSYVLQDGSGGEAPVTLSSSHWRDLLGKVLSGGRIRLDAQRIVSTGEGGAELGVEVLLRAYDEEERLIPAGQLVPMARRLGLAMDFDRRVIALVCQRLKDGRGPAGRVTVNVFPDSIRNPGFVDGVCEQLRSLGPLANRVILEVSESGAVEDLETLRSWILRVKQTGALTSLDHFGKGFASYAYLSTLKLDFLKIDGSHIRGIDSNRESRFFVDSVIKIAHGLDIGVMAESVETEAELQALRGLGVEAAQGYGIARPAAW